jgi:hypothetical protein
MNPKNFRGQIMNHFEVLYREDKEFLRCLVKLRKILYPAPPEDDLNLDDDLDKNDNEMEDTDPMKESLFRQCMEEIDDYLRDTKGCSEMQWIDSERTNTAYSVESVVGGSSSGGGDGLEGGA